MNTIDTLIHADWVLPINPMQSLAQHSVAISDGKIVDILPTAAAKQRYTAEHTFDRPEHVIMPGLINMHAHSPMTLFRGLADDLALMDWLNHHIWPAEGALMSPEFVRDGSLLAIAEMIKSGTTCFNEHYFYPEVISDVAKQAKIRAFIGVLIINVPTKWAKDENDGYQKALSIFSENPNTPLVNFTWAPHSPYMTTESMLAKIAQHADEHNVLVHMHVHETQDEIEQSNTRPVTNLKQLGLLTHRFQAVHMTQVNDADIQAFVDTGAHITHCPESNLKLASGYCPVQKLIDAGVNVALGTDGAASNNDLDMFGEMRSAAFIGKTTANNSTAVSAKTALQMATINGARALNKQDEIGSLEKGKAADMIAVNMNELNTQPCYDPISQLVYSVKSSQVSDVWVAGEQLLSAGKLTTIREDEVKQIAGKWREKILAVFEKETSEA